MEAFPYEMTKKQAKMHACRSEMLWGYLYLITYLFQKKLSHTMLMKNADLNSLWHSKGGYVP